MLQSTATKRKIILSQELQKMERKSLKAERRSENQKPRLLSLFYFCIREVYKEHSISCTRRVCPIQ